MLKPIVIKKTLYWYSRFGKIGVEEQTFTEVKGGQLVRPFSESAQVHCRGYSWPLQRVLTDFGADVAFGRIPRKLKEHHGIEVPISSAQAITQSHAQVVHESQVLEQEMASQPGVRQLIAEMDGTLLPIVETTAGVTEEGNPIDRRQTRQISFKEARLALVRASDEEQPHFGSTFGGVNEAGAQLLNSAIAKGLGVNTQVHAVGDGALWIANQVEAQFGEQATYLVDFYHVSEYLADASQVCAPENGQAWLKTQQTRLKHNQWPQVLAALHPYLEPASVDDKQALVRAAYRYIDNRSDQLDYQGALAAGLPIGSGEIESAHRYIILERLDIAGAWWTVDKAEQLMSLRVLRENNGWNDYWAEQMPCAA